MEEEEGEGVEEEEEEEADSGHLDVRDLLHLQTQVLPLDGHPGPPLTGAGLSMKKSPSQTMEKSTERSPASSPSYQYWKT
ncbi:hypothetical protein EYF80_033129 [Liparis tanakae]|uniref:Uncharacterized protein n=1 Tax=Liparis tanakae TaxID=230148 RepID=A0A4Z2GV29_9TELE|nr:hypothetical protein EYF80_033129 [Liparis tanakae]